MAAAVFARRRTRTKDLPPLGGCSAAEFEFAASSRTLDNEGVLVATDNGNDFGEASGLT